MSNDNAASCAAAASSPSMAAVIASRDEPGLETMFEYYPDPPTLTGLAAFGGDGLARWPLVATLYPADALLGCLPSDVSRQRRAGKHRQRARRGEHDLIRA